jgi:hypothetical protein
MDEQKSNHACCHKILQMIGVLHSRGYQRLRIFPYVREMWWRGAIAPGALFDPQNGACMESHPSHFRDGLIAEVSSGDFSHPFGWSKSIAKMSIEKMADLFIERFPAIARQSEGSDWAYAGWYQEMLMRISANRVPIAFYRDAYEEIVHDTMQLVCIDNSSDGMRVGEMPLPPLYPTQEQEDISPEEVQAIQNKVEEDFAKNGYPTEQELMTEIEAMNKSGN